MENINISDDTRLMANTEIFNKQNDLMWEQVRHVSTVEAGTFVGWWLTKDDYYTSTSLLIISISLLFILSTSIRKYSILLNRQHELVKFIQQTKRDEPEDRRFLGITLRGHNLARLCPTILILANIYILISSTIHYILTLFEIGEDASKLLYIIPVIALTFASYYVSDRSKTAIKSALYYMVIK